MSERDEGISGVDRMREMMEMKMDIFEGQVRKLKSMCDEGLIDEEEFAAAKAELFSRL
jgi:hypothetical protein